MTLLQATGLILLGIIAGFINTFAGGGSMLVVPFLIFLGLPANMANATNRVAIFLQEIVSTATFHQKKILDFKTDYPLLLPTTLGSIAGAFTAVDIQEELLRKVIGGLLIILFFMILLGKGKCRPGQSPQSVYSLPGLFRHRILRRFHSNWRWFFHAGRFSAGMRF